MGSEMCIRDSSSSVLEGEETDRQTDRQTETERETETKSQENSPMKRYHYLLRSMLCSTDVAMKKINEELVDKVPQLDRNHFGPKSSVPVIYTGSAFFFIGSECWGKNLYFCDS